MAETPDAPARVKPKSLPAFGALMRAGRTKHPWQSFLSPSSGLPVGVGVLVALIITGVVIALAAPKSSTPPLAVLPPNEFPYQGPVTGPQLTSSQCAAIVSNASLYLGIVHLYQGNGNSSGSGAGLILQSPPGPSAYPNESVAAMNVDSGWEAICTSPGFYPLEQLWGPQNASWSGLAQNTSGIYEFVFTVEWDAPLSSCTPGQASWSGQCMGTVQWLVNVASGAVSQPTESFWAPQPAP